MAKIGTANRVQFLSDDCLILGKVLSELGDLSAYNGSQTDKKRERNDHRDQNRGHFADMKSRNRRYHGSQNEA
jgi:hypothetical protein